MSVEHDGRGGSKPLYFRRVTVTVQKERTPVSTGIPLKDWHDASVARPPKADTLLGRCGPLCIRECDTGSG